MKDLFVATQLSQRTLTLALFLLNYNLLSGLCLIPYYRYLGTTCYRNIIAVACSSCGARFCALLFSGLPPCDGMAYGDGAAMGCNPNKKMTVFGTEQHHTTFYK